MDLRSSLFPRRTCWSSSFSPSADELAALVVGFVREDSDEDNKQREESFKMKIDNKKREKFHVSLTPNNFSHTQHIQIPSIYFAFFTLHNISTLPKP